VSERIAVVTGAAGGMGSAIVRRLAKDGFSVAGIDVAPSVHDTVAKLGGGNHRSYIADLTDEGSARAVVAEVERDFGRIDALVNTLGWTDTIRFVTENSDYWNKLIAINFQSVVYVVHAVLPGMIERTAGKIVNISSDAAKVGQSQEAVYAGAKGAVVAWSKSIAREVARYNINVNCVSPGPTETPLDAAIDEELISRVVRVIPFRRRAKPEEQANAVAFFVSSDADFITGQTLSVSGGLTMF
jgi:2-hydroxycyclohexanecarboxyl-CoA dehydrogenase